MITFMDYVLREFGIATDWNFDNSYSSLTATSDALLAFTTPSSLSINVSSLSTANFATAYTLSTLGQIDGSLSYLYSTVGLGHIPSEAPTIPLKRLIHGYRDIRLPVKIGDDGDDDTKSPFLQGGRKPTLLHATLALPPPSTLTALYARRLNPYTLLSLSVNSQSVTTPGTSGPPPATVLAHLQRDTGRYSVEGLGSTDNGLLGFRGLWNFGVSPSASELRELNDDQGLRSIEGSPSVPIPPAAIDSLSSYYSRLSSKPSLLSAGAEFYYSPFSHVIGLSTGLRFTTLASHIAAHDPVPNDTNFSRSKPLAGTSAALSNVLLTPSNVVHSSFPYTMTLTLTPLTGSLSSTYSVKPSPNLALSSRFDFNVYSWESQYVLGAEIWRKNKRQQTVPMINPDGSMTWPETDPTAWARYRARDWFSPAEQALKDERKELEEENVVKLRVDDGWNMKALWTGKIKSLLVSAGVSVGPVVNNAGGFRSKMALPVDSEGRRKRWTGSVGVSVAFSS